MFIRKLSGDEDSFSVGMLCYKEEEAGRWGWSE